MFSSFGGKTKAKSKDKQGYDNELEEKTTAII